MVPVEVDGLAILVAADLDGKIFAIANSCPHLGTPLENGRFCKSFEPFDCFIYQIVGSERDQQSYAHCTRVPLVLNLVSFR